MPPSVDVAVSAEGVQKAASFIAEQFLEGFYDINSWSEQPLNPRVADEAAVEWLSFKALILCLIST